MITCLRPLTERQTEFLRAIYHHAVVHGQWPTLKDLFEPLGIRSPNGIRAHLGLLAKKGYVWQMAPLHARSIRLAGASLRFTYLDSPAGEGLRGLLEGGQVAGASPREAELLRHIWAYAKAKGEWPTYRYLAGALGCHLNAILNKFLSLTQKGFLHPAEDRAPRARSIPLAGARLVFTFDDTAEGQRLREVVEPCGVTLPVPEC